MTRPAPKFAQLCVIVREQIEQLETESGTGRSPATIHALVTAHYSELVERIKWRLIAVGFGYPASPEQLSGAIEAVEHALEKQRRKGQR
jgi:hypothetical protein